MPTIQGPTSRRRPDAPDASSRTASPDASKSTAKPAAAAAPAAGAVPAGVTDGFEITYGKGKRIDGVRADFDQGQTNACGTTALAIAMHRLGTDVPVAEIDRSIRNYNLFTSERGIVSYAQGAGFQAEAYNQGNFEQLRGDLAAGRQVVVLTDVGTRDARGWLQRGPENDAGLHYMVVTEAAVASDGTEYVRFYNWGREETLPYADFEKLWSGLKVMDLPTGYDRSYVLVDAAGSQPLRESKHPEMEIANDLSGGLTRVTNGWSHARGGDAGGGAQEILGGVADLVRGGVNLLKKFFG